MSDVLDSDSITQQLARVNAVPPGGVHVYDTLDSTNAWAIRQCRNGAITPFACIADRQARGRGRRGRPWVSPPHSNVYLSLAWSFERPVRELGMLPIVIGKAVVDVLHALGITGAVQKWPNDVLVNAEKIAGILIETVNVSHAGCTAIIGIGLNRSMPADEVLDTRWTDVSRCLSGHGESSVPDRNRLATLLLHACSDACRRYQQRGAALLSDSRDMQTLFRGQAVAVIPESGLPVQGVAVGLTASGELRVQIDGAERVFNSADVSLRAV